MTQIELIVPTLLGVEAMTARELKKMGFTDITTENGRITFISDISGICKANLWLRTAERVLVKIGEFNATTFEELFEKTKALPWDNWIPKNAAFPVKGYSLKSKLYSVPDCQSIIKKAIVDKLKTKYDKDWFEEEGPLYQIQFSLMKNKVTLMIDTSGQGLHKRGYRENSNIAPLRETLASTMIMLSDYRYDRPLWDPFCGSGTIAIEGALIGANIAPGLKRSFASESWPNISQDLWTAARQEALDSVRRDVSLNIRGSDLDKGAVLLSQENAHKAGVDEHIRFHTMPFNKMQINDKYGCLICNPPYGERLGELKDAEQLYIKMGQFFNSFDTWSFYIITSHENFEKLYGKTANKNRKLYNGMIQCHYYQYFGPRPPRI